MALVLASEDQSMSDAAGNETNIGGNPDETFVDLSDQRVRVVRVD